MLRVLLIAEREFKAYASTASFWVALAMGPLMMGLGGLATGALHTGPAPRVISIQADRPEAAAAVQSALEDAAALQGRHLEIGPGGSRLTVTGETVRIAGTPLNQLESELLRRDLYALDLADRLRAKGDQPPAFIHTAPAPVSSAAPGRMSPLGRFAPVFLLWLTLVGALGMLLQSVVRERANRALEQLLAGARASEIVFGKLLGVGAISLLVLASWLGGAAAMAMTPLVAQSSLLSSLGSPLAALHAGAIYLMAFLMYGSALVCVGAAAPDLPSAQNLSRPVFGLLLVIFFLALGSTMGLGQSLSWLIWVPPFTPFMLLLEQGALPAWQVALAWTIMAAATAATTAFASRALVISPRPFFARRGKAPSTLSGAR
jgi:ABC-2 type transport system permease protein